MNEKPYIPFYKPYGMSDEEYQYEVNQAQERFINWENEQESLEKETMKQDYIKTIKEEDIKLEMTCEACPEQYEAFYEGKQVGYLRLRHGYFRVDYPDCGDKTIYTAEPKGDGIFEAEERDYYLSEAKKAIISELLK